MPRPGFAATQWTIVLRAGGEDVAAREALARLCKAYWLPLYVYVRRRGYSEHDAKDLTQGFFADLLERSAVKRADPARGRFRTFLLTSLVNYLHNAHRHADAAKRGGAVEKLSFHDIEIAETLAQVQGGGLSPDQAFDRSWTLALLDRAMKRLHAEQERLGKSKWFERVRPCLQNGSDSEAQASIAVEFGLTRNAVAVAIHRLAARYRELTRAEIAETVSSSDDLQAEQHDLLRSIMS